LRRTNFDPGGFAEFVRLPAINVEKGAFAFAESLSFAEATFVEPLACVLRGQRLSAGAKGKCVLVIGSGIAGALHILWSSFCAAKYIVATDISEYRLGLAKKFGAQAAIPAKEYSPEKLRQLNHGRLADLVIVSCGAAAAISQALESVERGGSVLFFAPAQKGEKIPLAFNELFWRTEITLTSSYAGSPADYQEALSLLEKKKLDVSGMITHSLPLEKIGLGFQLVAEAKESLKVIISPQK
jgi:L-iditol 2-dehydrogenase